MCDASFVVSGESSQCTFTPTIRCGSADVACPTTSAQLDLTSTLGEFAPLPSRVFYSYNLVFTSGDQSGLAVLSEAASGANATIKVIGSSGSPDATSLLDCDAAQVVQGSFLQCTISPKIGGVVSSGSPTDFVVTSNFSSCWQASVLTARIQMHKPCH